MASDTQLDIWAIPPIRTVVVYAKQGWIEKNRNDGRGGETRTTDLYVPNEAPNRWATPR